MTNNFSKNLKYYRTRNHITQQELAEKLYMTRQSISALETSRRCCDLDTLIRIADIFDITLDDLIR